MNMDKAAFAFSAGLIVNFVDQLGGQFTAPIIVPYGQWLGASVDTIALFITARGIMSIASNALCAILADKFGQRLVVIMSTVGCFVGYGMQAFAGSLRGEDPGPAIAMFAAGQAVAGLFSGVGPVINAFTAEISGSDEKLMTWRLVTLGVARQSAGIALSPIAGATASVQMQLPFWISTGAAVLGFFWALFFFPNEAEVKRLANGGREPLVEASSSGPTAARAVADAAPATKEANAACDSVILMVSVAFMLIFLPIQAMSFIIPLMLDQPQYGLQDAFGHVDRGEVSKMSGLLMMPQGLVGVFVQMFMFMPLVTRFGMLKVLTVGFLIFTVATLAYAFVVNSILGLALNAVVSGLGIGLVTPAVGPLIARYSNSMFPKQRAKAQSMPLMFMNISKSFASNILAALIGLYVDPQKGFAACWSLCSACSLGFGAFFVTGYITAEKRLARVESDKNEARLAQALAGLSTERQKLAAGSEDPDAFFNAVTAQLRENFEAQKHLLWNSSAQFVYKSSLLGAMPKLQQLSEWNDETGGAEYLEGLCRLLPPQSEERKQLADAFPQLGATANLDRRSGWGGHSDFVVGTPVPDNVLRRRAEGLVNRRAQSTSASMHAASLQPIQRHLSEPNLAEPLNKPTGGS